MKRKFYDYPFNGYPTVNGAIVGVVGTWLLIMLIGGFA